MLSEQPLRRALPPRYHIQKMLSKSMEELTEEDKNLIKIVRKYKVVDDARLEKLSLLQKVI